MKKILSIIIAILPILLLAQSAEQQVIGSAGGWGTAANVQVSSTVGETVVATGTSASVILTQGFQQPSTYLVAIEDVNTGLLVNAYPNPSKGLVMLQINAPNTMQLNVSVYDASGRLTSLPIQQLHVSGESTQAIDFSTLAAGHYYLQLNNREGSLSQSIKVQKID